MCYIRGHDVKEKFLIDGAVNRKTHERVCYPKNNVIGSPIKWTMKKRYPDFSGK